MNTDLWRTLRNCLVLGGLILLMYLGRADWNGKPSRYMQPSGKMCIDIARAISTYYSEYEKLPVEKSQVTSDLTLDSVESGELFGTLSAHCAPELNPKHLNFIDGLKQARYKDGKYIDGINFEGSESRPTLIDPWGKCYRITLDTTEDGQIENPENPGTNIIGKRAIVYSAGPDGNISTWDDNPRSW